jgi:LmbE family N-acetylglucosaminyl deacetylase
MSKPIDPTVGQRHRRPALTRDIRRLLAVVAHPDDESFGLGAVLDRFTACGIDASVLCFTQGEASTLHGRAGDLSSIRAAELRAAAATLGLDRVGLLDYPDGHLGEIPVGELATHVQAMIDEVRPSHLLVFDDTGVTGHRDHQQATAAALVAARASRLPVLAWVIPEHVASLLNARHGTGFRGQPPQRIDARLSVSRIRQRRAIAAHASQSTGNAVLHHRLRLLGDAEHVRLLYAPTTASPRRA